jgi:cell shape-determining protein MreC
MRRQLFSISIFAAMSIFAAKAQSPTPIVVQAASPANVSSTAAPSPVSDSDSLPVTIKLLQEMKTVNEEMLKKQAATLQQLDELQKAANELKIFSKRG